MTTGYRDVYAEPVIFDHGFIQVSDLHRIYYEQSGKKDGNPVIFLHGGPGSGSNINSHRIFDPDKYRVIVMDQRGAGKSTPLGEIKENTTWDLVADLERLRELLGIDRWVVYGGSWGSTLALAYAQSHPDRVKAMVMYGIFTCRQKEYFWSFHSFVHGGGASIMFPDYFEEFLKPIPEAEQKDVEGAYYRYLTGPDEEKKVTCGKAWYLFESAISQLQFDKKQMENYLETEEGAKLAVHKSRIECHYFINGAFLQSVGHLLDNVDKIRHIPATIVQGRYDVVCPMDTAWELHKRWPEAEFHIVPDAGHIAQEPGTQSFLLDATDKYAKI